MTPEERFESIERLLERAGQRIDAMAMNMELHHASMTADLAKMKELVRTDGESIRALARIAEIHEHRLTDLEGGV